MNAQQIKLVQSTFAQVVPIAATAADLFYGRLFETEPELRPMFPDDLTEQKKKLMGMLGTAVGGLSRLDVILPAVQSLGRRHAGYGVTAEHYAPVGAALLWTLEKGLGEVFTADARAAWTMAYTTLATAMIEAGKMSDAEMAA